MQLRRRESVGLLGGRKRDGGGTKREDHSAGTSLQRNGVSCCFTRFDVVLSNVHLGSWFGLMEITNAAGTTDDVMAGWSFRS